MRSLSFYGYVLLIPIAPTSGAYAQQDSPRLKNSSFAEWNNGVPGGWSVSIGATNGAQSPKSSVRKGADGSLELSGDVKTMAWNMVGQRFPVTANDTLQWRSRPKQRMFGDRGRRPHLGGA